METSSQGAIYEALFEYEPEKTDEVELKSGDRIRVSEAPVGGWWNGTNLRTNGSGWFPAPLVELKEVPTGPSAVVPQDENKKMSRKLNSASIPNLAERRTDTRSYLSMNSNDPDRGIIGAVYEALYEYDREKSDELNLKIGDRIRLLESPPGGWWNGINTQTNKVGWFPSACVKFLEPPKRGLGNEVAYKSSGSVNALSMIKTDASKSNSRINSQSKESLKVKETALSPLSAPPINASSFDDPGCREVSIDEAEKGIVGAIYKVVYPYDREKADELTLVLGQKILILECPEGGWWNGTDLETKQSGWFPATLVQFSELSTRKEAERPELPQTVDITADTSVAVPSENGVLVDLSQQSPQISANDLNINKNDQETAVEERETIAPATIIAADAPWESNATSNAESVTSWQLSETKSREISETSGVAEVVALQEEPSSLGPQEEPLHHHRSSSESEAIPPHIHQSPIELPARLETIQEKSESSFAIQVMPQPYVQSNSVLAIESRRKSLSTSELPSSLGHVEISQRSEGLQQSEPQQKQKSIPNIRIDTSNDAISEKQEESVNSQINSPAAVESPLIMNAILEGIEKIEACSSGESTGQADLSNPENQRTNDEKSEDENMMPRSSVTSFSDDEKGLQREYSDSSKEQGKGKPWLSKMMKKASFKGQSTPPVVETPPTRSRSVSSPIRPNLDLHPAVRLSQEEKQLRRNSEYSTGSKSSVNELGRGSTGSNGRASIATSSIRLDGSFGHNVRASIAAPSFATNYSKGSTLKNEISPINRFFDPTSPTTAVNETPGANNSENLLLLLDNPTSTWKDFVDPERLALLSPKEIKRQTAIWELISTEKDYIRDLNLIKTVIEEPLLEKKILNPKIAEKIFLNAGALLHVNRDFLDKLEGRLFSQGVIEFIGDILINMGEKFLAYTLYCSNHNGATKQLQQTLKSNSAFKNFLEEIYKSNVMRSLDLNSYLLKPVQRICKYPLLIREVIKHTDPQSADYAALLEAQDKISAIMSIINEGARNNGDGTKKLIDIQNNFTEKLNFVTPNRYVVREDELFIMLGGAKKSRKVFLFNDLLIIARKDWRDKLHLIEKASLRDCRVCDVQSAESDSTFLFELIAESNSIQAWFFEVEIGQQEDESNNSRYLFVCPTQEVKKTWINCYKVLTQLKVKHKYITALDGVDNGVVSEESEDEEIDPNKIKEEKMEAEFKKKEIELQTKIYSLDNDVLKLKESEKQLIAQLEEYKAKQTTLTSKLQELSGVYEATTAKLEGSEKSNKELKMKLTEKQAAMESMAKEFERKLATQDELQNIEVTSLNQTIQEHKLVIEDLKKSSAMKLEQTVAQFTAKNEEIRKVSDAKIQEIQRVSEQKVEELNLIVERSQAAYQAKLGQLKAQLETTARERDNLTAIVNSVKAETSTSSTVLQDMIHKLEKTVDEKTREMAQVKQSLSEEHEKTIKLRKEAEQLKLELSHRSSEKDTDLIRKEEELNKALQRQRQLEEQLVDYEKRVKLAQDRAIEESNFVKLEKQRISALQAEIVELKAAIAQGRYEVEKVSKEKDDVSAELTIEKAQTEIIRLRNSQLEGRLQELSDSFNNKLDNLTIENNSLRINLENQMLDNERLQRELQEAYERFTKVPLDATRVNDGYDDQSQAKLLKIMENETQDKLNLMGEQLCSIQNVLDKQNLAQLKHSYQQIQELTLQYQQMLITELSQGALRLQNEREKGQKKREEIKSKFMDYIEDLTEEFKQKEENYQKLVSKLQKEYDEVNRKNLTANAKLIKVTEESKKLKKKLLMRIYELAEAKKKTSPRSSESQLDVGDGSKPSSARSERKSDLSRFSKILQVEVSSMEQLELVVSEKMIEIQKLQAKLEVKASKCKELEKLCNANFEHSKAISEIIKDAKALAEKQIQKVKDEYEQKIEAMLKSKASDEEALANELESHRLQLLEINETKRNLEATIKYQHGTLIEQEAIVNFMKTELQEKEDLIHALSTENKHLSKQAEYFQRAHEDMAKQESNAVLTCRFLKEEIEQLRHMAYTAQTEAGAYQEYLAQITDQKEFSELELLALRREYLEAKQKLDFRTNHLEEIKSKMVDLKGELGGLDQLA